MVSGEFFTDRIAESEFICQKLNSENHLILISPRRYGKSSLVRKCLTEINRPYIWLDLQYVLSTTDFAEKMLKAVLSLYPYERIKYEISHFRIVPTFSTSPLSNEWQISFQPSADTSVLLEDVMRLVEHVSSPDRRLVVVLDEFQEVCNIDKNLDKQLRSLMQQQQGLNYIMLGSQESMMHEIFEQKKSPFYHFGQLMHLHKIPYDDFYQFVFSRLPDVPSKDTITAAILSFTQCHPYYTQQLASQVWDNLSYKGITERIIEESIAEIVQEHDLDYERLWNNLNRTDRSVILLLSKAQKPLQNKSVSTSTTFSALKRLQKSGIIIRDNSGYQIEDPFFMHWLLKS